MASKPVKLQVNTKGTWRDVIRFDGADEPACGEAMSAAETLARIGSAKFRVVIDDGLQSPLMHLTPGEGWKEARWQS